MNKILAYVRTSTDKQDLNNQKLEILEDARQNDLRIDDFIAISMSSRKHPQERRIDELFARLNPGDMPCASREHGRHQSKTVVEQNVFRALQSLDVFEEDLEILKETVSSSHIAKLLKAIPEFYGYIRANRAFIPNYGDRYRHGERISTGFVESTVNQVISKRFVKKQQMRWTKRGIHGLLQVRIKVLNEDWHDTFSRWYPDMPSCDADNLTDKAIA